jgi:hypothetical protein
MPCAERFKLRGREDARPAMWYANALQMSAMSYDPPDRGYNTKMHRIGRDGYDILDTG